MVTFVTWDAQVLAQYESQFFQENENQDLQGRTMADLRMCKARDVMKYLLAMYVKLQR